MRGKRKPGYDRTILTEGYFKKFKICLSYSNDQLYYLWRGWRPRQRNGACISRECVAVGPLYLSHQTLELKYGDTYLTISEQGADENV